MIVVGVVGAAGAAVFGRLRPRPNVSGVELRLSGSVTSARIRYSAPGGVVTGTVRLPWGYQLPAVAGRPATLNATGAAAAGELVCEILVHGRQWRIARATGSSPTVSCEGVIGAP